MKAHQNHRCPEDLNHNQEGPRFSRLWYQEQGVTQYVIFFPLLLQNVDYK